MREEKEAKKDEGGKKKKLNLNLDLFFFFFFLHSLSFPPSKETTKNTPRSLSKHTVRKHKSRNTQENKKEKKNTSFPLSKTLRRSGLSRAASL